MAHGAELRCGAVVSRILTSGGRAVGVVTEAGDTFYAGSILSNAHPAITCRLLDSGTIPDMAQPLANWKSEGIACKINLAVTELPDFTCMPGKEVGPQHLGTVHLAPSMNFLDAAWQEARLGRPSSGPMVEVYIQTATDRSLAPGGRHILSCFTQYYPFTMAPGLDHSIELERYADRVVETIASYAPNVPTSVEAREVLSPRELEQRFGLVGGHIFHGDITPNQMFGNGSSKGRLNLLGPRTELAGLLLCGSGAFPGGCVSGFPGYNAAHYLLAGH